VATVKEQREILRQIRVVTMAEREAVLQMRRALRGEGDETLLELSKDLQSLHESKEKLIQMFKIRSR
jgi:hypothetical protein